MSSMRVVFAFKVLFFSVQLSDPDSVKGRHSHGCNGDTDVDEPFWSSEHRNLHFLR